MIEGAVLLHQDDDVFDIIDRAGAAMRGNLQRPADARRKCCGERAGSQELEKSATIVSHGWF